jgi:hypothetical protein
MFGSLFFGLGVVVVRTDCETCNSSICPLNSPKLSDIPAKHGSSRNFRGVFPKCVVNTGVDVKFAENLVVNWAFYVQSGQLSREQNTFHRFCNVQVSLNMSGLN